MNIVPVYIIGGIAGLLVLSAFFMAFWNSVVVKALTITAPIEYWDSVAILFVLGTLAAL